MTPWKFSELTGRPPPRGKLWGFGLGAGILGAAVFGLRYLVRPPTTTRIPDDISPPAFATRAFPSSRGQMIYHESSSAGAASPRHALVFIHDPGVGASSYEWSKVYAQFAPTHHVLAPDLIGFGESERPRTALLALEHVAVLAEFLRAVNTEPQPPVLIASGLAAAFCLRLAADQPQVVSRLILLTPRGTADVSWKVSLASRLGTLNRLMYRNYLARRASLREHLERYAFADPLRVTAEMVEVHALCAQQYQAEFAVYQWLRGRLNLPLESSCAGLARPAALLAAGKAPKRDMECLERLSQINRHFSRPRVVPGFGPLLGALEAPGAVAQAIREELAGDKADPVE